MGCGNQAASPADKEILHAIKITVSISYIIMLYTIISLYCMLNIMFIQNGMMFPLYLKFGSASISICHYCGLGTNKRPEGMN